ncbi:hypothetical protein CapIbe_003345 [Capra ibex]
MVKEPVPPTPPPHARKSCVSRVCRTESSLLGPHPEASTCSSPNRTCYRFLNRLYPSCFFAYTPFSPVHFENYEGLECKNRKSRNTWSNRQIWS